MFLEVPVGDLGVGGVAPFDLTEASACCLEMGEIHSPCLVVVREMADLPSLRSGLDDGEG